MRLPTPATEAGRAGLAALLAGPSTALLAMDFDGTLSPIVPDPDRAKVRPDIPPALARLSGLGVRVAVVTGRPADFPVERGGLAGVPGLVVLGHYGAQRWEGGVLSGPAAHEGVAQVRRRLPALLADVPAPQGTYVEDKGHAVAVHTRRTAEPAAAFDALRGPVSELAEEAGLVVEPGRYVLELRPAGGDKGVALRGLVKETAPPVVVFVGDDLGDLPAFAEVARLRDSGTPGLLVCSGSTEVSAVAELADLVVDGPEGVAGFLLALAEAAGR